MDKDIEVTPKVVEPDMPYPHTSANLPDMDIHYPQVSTQAFRGCSSKSEFDLALSIAEDLIESGVAKQIRKADQTVTLSGTSGSSEEAKALIESMNTFITASFKQQDNLEEALSTLPLDEISESRLVLRQRFVKKRTQFYRQHNILDSKTFSALIDIKDSNPSRKLNRMREQGKVLALRTNDGFVYPEFQLDTETCVYTGLQAELPRLYEKLTGWDIAFWLTTPATLITKLFNPSADEIANLSGQDLSLDQIVDSVLAPDLDDGSITAKPIELLEKGESKLFSEFVTDYLNPQERVIPRTEV
ncbi:hypothetical protein [Vibrio sp. SCSIO 43137]|uniref:hypothetical protein n=1 Tax=Vibrio sp. SCSIO 43137 TaxID=3021011 RepID=UPI002307DE87|nr:hypothetical protein [Vibrio sp. SCSIO 43137]WCE31893.1 hypothetical protein PK654_22475 [Vibrio sp. SCSIO 43137]